MKLDSDIKRLVSEAKVDCDCGCVETAIDELARLAQLQRNELTSDDK